MNYSKNNNENQIKEHSSKRKKNKNRTLIVIFRFVLITTIIVIFALAGAAAGIVVGIIKTSPSLNTVAAKPNMSTTKIYADDGVTITRKLSGYENREFAPLASIPIDMQHAIVSIEDERFYTHNGIDIRSLFRSAYKTITGARVEGGSTITQQVIKNNVTQRISGSVSLNTIKIKIQEMYLAVQYEKMLEEQLGSKVAAKDYILETYLNTIALGHGQNGVKTGTQYYFNKDIKDLTLSEAVVLAGITQSPTRYSPKTYPENNAIRKEMVLTTMKRNGYITEEQYVEVQNDNIYDRIAEAVSVNEDNETINTYYDDALIDQISRDLQEKYLISAAEASNKIYSGGLQVYSNQNINMQKIVNDAFLDDSLFPSYSYEIDVEYKLSTKNSITNKETHHPAEKFTVKNKEEMEQKIEEIKKSIVTDTEELLAETTYPVEQPQASMVIMDYRNGNVKAITGGRGEKVTNRSYNRAIDAKRQPGSVFKILAAYAPAIDLGIVSQGTLIMDEEYSIGDSEIHNWYTGYRGMTTIRTAIADSMNVIAVKTLMKTGIDEAFQYLKNFGITTLIEEADANGNTDKVPVLALGGITYGVTEMEVTAAYGAIANQGELNKPILYTKVLDAEGNIILENVQNPTRVLKKQSADILTDMMTDVVTKGTGGKARFKKVSMPVSGKTGTTSDDKDFSFVGYTPYYAAGIWMGYDNPKQLKKFGNEHLLIWRTVMERIHESLPRKEFSKATGLIAVEICVDSGLLAVPGSNAETKTEYFIPGTEPTTYCENHESVKTEEEISYVDPETGIEMPIIEDESSTENTEETETNEGVENIETTPTPTPINPTPKPTATPIPVPEYTPGSVDPTETPKPEPEPTSGPIIQEENNTPQPTSGPIIQEEGNTPEPTKQPESTSGPIIEEESNTSDPTNNLPTIE